MAHMTDTTTKETTMKKIIITAKELQAGDTFIFVDWPKYGVLTVKENCIAVTGKIRMVKGGSFAPSLDAQVIIEARS